MASVAARLMTVEEFERLGSDLRVELVRGELVETPMPGAKHGVLCFWLAYLLQKWIDREGQGLVMTNDTFVRTHENPPSVRGGDIIYIRTERFPDGNVPEGTLRTPPNLIVEVLSPSDRWGEVLSKVTEYLEIGVQEVWVVDEVDRAIDVFQPNHSPKRLESTDELVSPDVLPGFTVQVSEVFQKV